MESCTKRIDRISFNGLGAIKDESGSVSMMLKEGMEAEEYIKVLNYRPPIK